MANEFVDTTLMDGFADGPHITEVQTGLANQGLYGPEDYVLESGRKAEAQVLTNNSIRIFDAVFVIQGRRDVIAANDYADVSIDNGAQGMNRNDIIVRRYVKDESTEIEHTEYAVIKGTAVSGEASDPDVTVGDIRSGATLHEMKLYRVRLQGLNIVAVEPLFKVLLNMSTINDSLSYLIGNKISKYDVSTGSGEILTGEAFSGKPIYMRLVDIGVLPSNASKTLNTGINGAYYFWIDPTYSMAISGGAEYPLPYVDPENIANSIAVRLISNAKQVVVTTKANWSSYAGFVAVKYTKA